MNVLDFRLYSFSKIFVTFPLAEGNYFQKSEYRPLPAPTIRPTEVNLPDPQEDNNRSKEKKKAPEVLRDFLFSDLCKDH